MIQGKECNPKGKQSRPTSLMTLRDECWRDRYPTKPQAHPNIKFKICSHIHRIQSFVLLIYSLQKNKNLRARLVMLLMVVNQAHAKCYQTQQM